MLSLENWISLFALVVGPAGIIVFCYRAIRRGEARQLTERRARYTDARSSGATHTEALQRSGAADEEVTDLGH